jgi:predicted SnoaL-like aldol condensation-catalyzing enzyme
MRNKALVLKAFDTLFNKRDYAAVERLWSPNYIQPSAHIEPGREGHKYSQIFKDARNLPGRRSPGPDLSPSPLGLCGMPF